MKAILKLLFCVVALAAGIAAWNYFSVTQAVSTRLGQDIRNEKVSMWAYHQYGLVPAVLVVDLRGVDGKTSQLDVLRALFHSADALKEKRFEKVILAYKGRPRFALEGDYYQKLGAEFGIQNPVYTLRTLPQNVRNLDGTSAFDTWTGGMLGVLMNQMKDLNAFSEAWYLFDYAKDSILAETGKTITMEEMRALRPE